MAVRGHLPAPPSKAIRSSILGQRAITEDKIILICTAKG